MRTLKMVMALICLLGTNVRGQDATQLELPDTPIEFGMVEVDGENFNVTVMSTQFETREQTFTVSVPYQETVGNKTVTRMRQETRTRTVTVPIMIAEVMSVPAEAISFSSLASGKQITNLASIKKSLAKPRAAAITYSSKPLGGFYRQVLNPSIVVVHIDRDKLNAQPTAAPTPSALDDLFEAPASTTNPVADDFFGDPQPQKTPLPRGG